VPRVDPLFDELLDLPNGEIELLAIAVQIFGIW
jgi:hypothetical protein